MKNNNNIVIGTKSKATSNYSVGLGNDIQVGFQSVGLGGSAISQATTCGYGSYAGGVYSIAIGLSARAEGKRSTAIGVSARAYDLGATVIRSTAEDGTYTQLYFSGANTPLALKYYPTEWEKKQDVDEQGKPRREVDILIERIQKIRSELPPSERVELSPEEAAFMEAADEQYEALSELQRRRFRNRR